MSRRSIATSALRGSASLSFWIQWVMTSLLLLTLIIVLTSHEIDL